MPLDNAYTSGFDCNFLSYSCRLPITTDTSRKVTTKLSCDVLNPAHVYFSGVNTSTLGRFCTTRLIRADNEVITN